MIPLIECKEVLNQGGKRYTEAEVKGIRDLLYRLGSIAERIHDEYRPLFRSSGLVGVMYLGLSSESKSMPLYFQKYFMDRYCDGHSIPIYQHYQERPRNTNERPVLRKLITSLDRPETKPFNCIVISEWAALGTTIDEAWDIITKARNAQIAILCARHPIPTKGYWSKMLIELAIRCPHFQDEYVPLHTSST